MPVISTTPGNEGSYAMRITLFEAQRIQKAYPIFPPDLLLPRGRAAGEGGLQHGDRGLPRGSGGEK